MHAARRTPIATQKLDWGLVAVVARLPFHARFSPFCELPTSLLLERLLMQD
jgi:hypothetical protein